MQQQAVEGFRLSPQQERLWTLGRDGRELSYRSRGAVAIAGELDRGLLQAALEDVVQRHEILRTSLYSVPGLKVPVQVVGEARIRWGVEEDLTALDSRQQSRRIEAILGASGEASADTLELRLALLRLGSTRHLLLIDLPAFRADARTLSHLVHEIARSYAERLDGEPTREDEPIQYSAVAEWLSELLDSADAREGIRYWLRYDLSDPERWTLPFEYDAREPADFVSRTLRARIPSATFERLAALAAELGVSISTILFSCWYVLLWRLTGDPELVVGVACDGRTDEELEQTLGLLTRFVPVSSPISDRTRVSEVFRAFELVLEESNEWQECFSWQTVETNGGVPFLPFCHEFLKIPAPYETGSLCWSLDRHSSCIDRYKALFSCVLSASTLTIELRHDAVRLPEPPASRMFDQIRTLIENVVDHPGAEIGDLEILGRREREQLLVQRNATVAEYPQDRSVHERFEQTASQVPERVAVELDERTLSYRELDARANRWGRHLRRLGVGPDVVVAICIERSPAMVVAIFAVLKAGGGYVPIDPSYPRERISFMLEDCGAALVLTRQELSQETAASGRQVVFIDGDRGAARGSRAAPGATVTGENLAYVIYTSGSTGRPKGAMVLHRGLSNHMSWMEESFPLGDRGRVLQRTPFSFDASVWEFYAPLLAGGRLVMARPGSHGDPTYLATILAQRNVTTLQVVPSLLRVLLEEPGLERCATLERVFCGGEPLSAELVERFRTLLPSVRLINVYGPTETSIQMTSWVFDEGAAPLRVPIGRPISNVRVYVLDSRLRLAPLGVPGELHIGGAGVGRGYLHRPALTARRFVANPFADPAGSRIYKTGDLVRWGPAEALEFLGRIDHQVKVRGFRIELGEIEAVLDRHPGIRESCVVARDAGPEATNLVAYLVPAQKQSRPSSTELAEHLARKLPDFMVPSSFVVLDALPLAPNGKVDRKALPAPEEAVSPEGGERAAPRTPIEEMVAASWAELLGAEQVGIHDEFLKLGGHSLLATRLLSRLRAEFRIELSLSEFFAAPTVARQAELVSAAMRDEHIRDLPPLEPVPRDGGLPLSFAQQRLWFLDQLQPGSATYNLPEVFRLRGRLDVRLFERALGEVIRRHEILRTRFPSVDGHPRQVAMPFEALVIPVVDLRGLAEAAREPEAVRLARGESRRAFDLARGPMLRIRLVRLGEDHHVVLFNLHHIVSDGWSQNILLREVTSLARAFVDGRPSPLPELVVQYGDYAAWQRAWLAGEVLERETDFWKEQLAGAPPRLELPTDRPRPALMTDHGARTAWRWRREPTSRLRRISREERATLFMALVGSFQALLSRYSGQDDVSVGTPIAGRNRVETEALIGFFVNTLVLRIDFSGDPGFRELVRQVREKALGAYSHQELPFEMLVEELEPERAMTHSPLFQVMFVQNTTNEGISLEFPGVEPGPFSATAARAMFDLTFSVEEWAGELYAHLEYNVDLFDASTVSRMLSHYENLLAGVVSAPERRLSELALLGATERHQMLAEWNDTRATAALSGTLAELFERRVDRDPEAVAVVSEGRRLSYREVEREACRLAHRLRSLGVRRGSLVAVYLERSARMVTSLLGILKAGGAYVPLSDSNPPARLSWILDALGVEWLVSEDARLDRLSQVWAKAPALRHVICVEASPRSADPGSRSGVRRWGPEDLADRSVDRLAPVCGPEDLAYVIFTSGSTGTPKGVAVQHGPALNLIGWVNDTFAVGPSDRVLFVTSLSFDLSVYDVFGVLGAGGSVRVASAAELSEPRRLVSVLGGESITFWDSAPAALQQLEPFFPAPGGPVSALRRVFLSGDWVPLGLPDRVRESFPGASVVALGGATEATVWSNYHRVEEVAPSWSSIPYGRPIRNARYHVLDAVLGGCPVGVAGDLFIGGECLASGYAGEAGRSASKFLPDPFADAAGARLYRTGDRARYRGDGTLEFLGRLDHQVKVRGFRIELGEIETVLSQHPGVRESVVLVRDERLCAFLLPEHPQAPPSAEELRGLAQDRLPEYMVPSSWVVLESLPLTPNGKLDRGALSSFEVAAAAPRLVAPRTAVEGVLSSIWAQLLGREAVGIHDNFFELGGHSLLATQVLSRLREAFGVELALQALFESPTVAGLGAAIEVALGGERRSSAPPIEPVSRTRALPLSFAQERLWFLDQLEPGSAEYNIPEAVRIRGDLSIALLQRVFSEIARRHESLRTRFAVIGEEPVQVIDEPRPVALPQVDLGGLAEPVRERVARRLAAAQAAQPFDLARGPLLRLALVRLAEREHVVLITLHHIVGDGWSMELMVSEVAALFEAYSSGRSSPLEALAIQYGDYAHWQRRWLAGEVLEAELVFWRRRLAGAPALLELPTDRPRPVSRGGAGRQHHFVLPENLAAQLRRLSREAGATPFMTLIAAFKALLARLSGQDDLTVGTPSAGRHRLEIEPLIGFFVNTHVLRTRVRAEESFHRLLEQVRERSLEAHAHQDVPLEKLVAELEVERDLSHAPLFQVMFLLQNVPRRDARFAGLELEPFPIPTATAKFDLTLEIHDRRAGLAAFLEYDEALFDSTTVRRWAGSFEHLLCEIVTDPGKALGDLELFAAAQRQQVLVEWDATAVSPRPVTVHRLFEEWAERAPEHVAIRFADDAVSYGELERRSARLARGLRRLGAARRERVALMLRSAARQVEALLAVAKAGGAFVALDPDHPAGRLERILDEIDPRLVIGDADSLEQHGDRLRRRRKAGPALLVLDANGEEAAEWVGRELPADAECAADLDDPFFIVYTSGSTGRPKGIVQTHRSFSQFLQWQSREFESRPGAKLMAWASVTYDAAYCEIFGALGFGATLCMAPKTVRFDPFEWIRWIDHEAIHLVQVVPSFLRQVLDAAPRGAERSFLASVDRIFLAGEALSSELVRRARKRLGERVRITNLYGPTETVLATSCRVEDRELERSLGVPLGRAIDGRQILILDRRQRPVPPGARGEICIRSHYLSQGYFRRPEETRRGFLPSPLPALFDDPVYRTGDLGRWRADGQLEFAGRIDHQIKLRGMRIEPGEIESALERHESVKACAVLAEVDEKGDQRLVAYLELADPTADGHETAHRLEADLQRVLPAPWLPSAYHAVDELPRTRTGKLDRRALVGREGDLLLTGRPYEAPRGAVQAMVAEVWREVLGLETVGAGDHFFRLGGHSLLAIRAVNRLRRKAGVELALRKIFEAPTVAALAAEIESLQESPRLAGPERIERLPRGGASYPVSFGQQRLWFMHQLDPQSAAYNMSHGIRLTGRFHVEAFEKALDEVVRRHESLRTVFGVEDGLPVQIILPQLHIEVPREDLRGLAPEECERRVRELALAEATAPFDLARGPLLRTRLLLLGEKTHVLLFAMHHAISDAWSMEVLIRELVACYEALRAGRAPSLPELPIQYVDFAAWQRRRLAGGALEEHLDYWRSKLAGVVPLELPLDRPRPRQPTHRGARLAVTLETQLTADLRKLALEQDTTTFTVLLAAYLILLARWSGQSDVVVGIDVANRNRLETERLIGFLANQLPLRVGIGQNRRFLEVLADVRKTSLEAYSWQDLPFQELVAALRPKRQSDPRHNPFFQVMFSLQRALEPIRRVADVELHDFKQGAWTASFDLTLRTLEADLEMVAEMEYSLELFDAASIEKFLGRFKTLLKSITKDPEALVETLDMSSRSERREEAMPSIASAPNFKKFKKVKPKSVSLSEMEVVRKGYLESGRTFPLLVEPGQSDADLAEWTRDHREQVENDLLQHGAVLFRGFGIDSTHRFEHFATQICSDLFNENGEHPRESVSGKVYTPVFFPPEEQLLWHNENSFNHRWPLKIFFCCQKPADQGGETPLVDSRKIFEKLDESTRQAFMDKQVVYVRNYGEGLGLGWQTVFGTDDKGAIENHCRENHMEFKWLEGDRLRTYAKRPAVTRHPKTKELCWFNQAQHWHPACLNRATRESLESMFTAEEMPRNCFFGDMSEIAAETMEEILAAYRELEVAFPWQRGDVVLVDNMLAAHGRNPFSGQRKILVAMGEMASYSDLDP